jgi:hypothetical protein
VWIRSRRLKRADDSRLILNGKRKSSRRANRVCCKRNATCRSSRKYSMLRIRKSKRKRTNYENSMREHRPSHRNEIKMLGSCGSSIRNSWLSIIMLLDYSKHKRRIIIIVMDKLMVFIKIIAITAEDYQRIRVIQS